MVQVFGLSGDHVKEMNTSLNAAYLDSSSLSQPIWHSSLAGAKLDPFPHAVLEPTDLSCPTAVLLGYEQKFKFKITLL